MDYHLKVFLKLIICLNKEFIHFAFRNYKYSTNTTNEDFINKKIVCVFKIFDNGVDL